MRSILHVSDLHFGPKHLPELSGAIAALVASARPDVVVASGDFTQRAKPGQFREARRFLERLETPVVFAPGNHDVPLWRVWERTLSPFGAWRRHFASELERHHVDGEVAIVAVNTAFAWTTKHGRVTAAQTAAVEAAFAAAPAAAYRIVVAHHPLAHVAPVGEEPAARGGERLLDRLRRHRVGLVLSGHLHHSFVARAGKGADAPLLVHCGTTSSSRGRGLEAGRNSLFWIEVDDGGATLGRRLWDPARREFVEVERVVAAQVAAD